MRAQTDRTPAEPGKMGKGKSAAAPKKGSGVLTPLVTAGAVLSLVVALIVAYNAGLTRVHTAQRAGARDDASGGGADDTGRRPAQRAAPARAGARAAGEPRDAIALQAALREQASAEQASAKQTAATAAADASACEDSNDSCGAWAEAGECDNNPGFMRGNCARSCRQCTPPPTSGPLAWMLPPLAGVDWAALDAADRDEPPPSDDDLARHCAVASLLSPLPIRGLHVVCALPSGPAAADRSAPPLAGARLAVWRDADRSAGGGRPSHVFRLPRAGGGARTMAELLSVLGARLRFEWRGAQWQPPAWFTPDGVRLLTVAAVSNRLGSGMPLCVFEGGQFIWPPGEVDTARKVALPDGHLATIRTLSIQPIVLSIEDFLQPDETGHMIQRALPHLAKSGVALKDHDLGKEAKEFRTSSQFFLPTDGDARLEDVDARVQALMRVPITHAEYIQVLRYNHNEHYSAQCARPLRAPARGRPRRAARAPADRARAPSRGAAMIISTRASTRQTSTCGRRPSMARRTGSPPSSSTCRTWPRAARPTFRARAAGHLRTTFLIAQGASRSSRRTAK